MPTLFARLIRVGSSLIVNPQVVEVDIATIDERKRSHSVDPPKPCGQMRLVVENPRVGFDGLGRESIDAPRRRNQNGFYATERMHCEIDKELREIELILIDLWAWSADPVVFPIAHQLRENTYVFSQAEIAKEQIALQQVSAATLGLLSPKRIVKALIAFADFTAERKIPVPSRVEWYVFERIPEIITTCRIAEVTEIVIVSRI